VVSSERFEKLPTYLGRLFTLTIACTLVFAPLLPAIAADLPTIKKRGRIVIAVKDNSPPLGFRSSEGNLQGFEIDLAHQLAQELLGRSDAVEFKPVLNQDRFSTVLDGQVDVAIAKVSLTPSRLRILRFSIPYYTDGTAILTNDPAIQKPSDLARKPIAVLEGSSTIEALRRSLPSATLVGATSYDDAKTRLDNGSVAAFAADASTLSGWQKISPQYRLLSPKLSTNLLCIVLPKGEQYEDLKEQIDLLLARLKANGWLEERARYWGLPIE
jgi:polar amino acid transport system substrate-binding protein